MDPFDSYFIRKLYKKTARHHDKLAKIEKQINWNTFRPIIQPMYSNKTPLGGRPNMDPVLMMILLVLQAWYGLSDPELERQGPQPHRLHALPRLHRESTRLLDSVDAQGTPD